MWKKDDKKERSDESTGPAADSGSGSATGRASRLSAETATIGRSIRINGEVTGDEDLVIQGHVDGSVELSQHSVTVGPDGDVRASITGKVITVEGHVEGDLEAGEQIVLRSSASVEGDLTAPRVVLEDGARFRGGVEMGEAGQGTGKGRGVSASAPRSSEPSRPSSSSGSSSSSDSSSASAAVESTSPKGNGSGDASAEVAS